MIHSISYAELESLSTQTLRSFAAEIIGELERLGEHPQLAQTLGFIRLILQTRGVVKQPKPRGPGFEASVPSPVYSPGPYCTCTERHSG